MDSDSQTTVSTAASVAAAAAAAASALPPPHVPSRNPRQRNEHRYIISVETGDRASWGGGTNLPVAVTLIGDQGISDELILNQLPNSLRYAPPYVSAKSAPTADTGAADGTDGADALFSSGSVREFQTKLLSVGDLVKLRVRLLVPKDTFDAAWKLEKVFVTDDTLHRGWRFVASRWLTATTGTEIEIEHSGDISAGRRATHISARRLSNPSPDVALDTPNAARFATSLSYFRNASHAKRFSVDSAAAPMLPATGDGGATATDGGVRRVCFQVQKFERQNCHLYLSGDTDMMGKWHVQGALRMRMVTSADGAFSGEWRLELEMDDASAVVQYAYLVQDEVSERAWWENGSAAKPRLLNLVGSMAKDDPTDRTVEGGVLYVKDVFCPIPDADFETNGAFRDSVTRPLSFKTRSSISSLHDDVVGEKKSDETIPNVDFSYLCGDDDASSIHISVPELNCSLSSDLGNIAASETREELARKLIAARDVLTKREGYILDMQHTIRDLESRLEARDASPAGPDGSTETPAPAGEDSFANSNRARTSPVSSDLNAIDDSILDSDVDDDLIRADGEETLARVRVIGQELKAAQLAMARRFASHVESDCENLRRELAALRKLMSEKCEEHESSHAELVRLVMDGQEARAAEVAKLTEERRAVQQRWNIEFAERRRLFNLVQELRGNIRVFCRVRPPKERCISNGDSSNASSVSFPDTELGLVDECCSIQVSQRRFEFDYVFQPDADQQSVYAETSGVVVSVLDGYNVCVFAYGQTGSGKTFTMNGTPSDPGVNYRALTDLFENIERRSTHSDFEVCVSMMEIYNENLHDLLVDGEGSSGTFRNDAPPKLEIRKDPASTSQTSVHVPNLTSSIVSSVTEVWSLMERGARNRAQHATDMNEHSSRSHLILSVKVSVTNIATGVRSRATLSLVDLAGSERLNRSHATGDRLKEAQFINKSLSTLGDVFMALVEKSPHVPYRNSKLTYLLQESLGGDSKTLMFVNISVDEADTGETLSSLQFAQRVAKVERGPASKHLDTTGLKSGATSDALRERDVQISSLQARLAGMDRDLRKRDEAVEVLRKRAVSAEAELKNASKLLDDQKRRDGIEKKAANLSAATSARELHELRHNEEKRKEELRGAKLKLRDMVVAKDEEIKRLQAAVDERNAQIRRLQLEQRSSVTATRAVVPNGVESSIRGASRARMPPRTGAGSRTFTAGQTRTVRFEPPKANPQGVGQVKELRNGVSTPVLTSLGGQDCTDPLNALPPSEAENDVRDVVVVENNGGAVSDRSDEDSAPSVTSHMESGSSTDPLKTQPFPVSSEGDHALVEHKPANATPNPELPRASTISKPNGVGPARQQILSNVRTPGRAVAVNGSSLTPGSTGPAKRGAYAFGTRVEVRENSATEATPTRTPRSTPNLRPAQRLVSNSVPRGQTAVKLPVRPPARAGPGLRRAGTFTSGTKPPPSQL